MGGGSRASSLGRFAYPQTLHLPASCDACEGLSGLLALWQLPQNLVAGLLGGALAGVGVFTALSADARVLAALRLLGASDGGLGVFPFRAAAMHSHQQQGQQRRGMDLGEGETRRPLSLQRTCVSAPSQTRFFARAFGEKSPLD